MLKKYSPALFAGWQDRYVEIEGGILKYFKDEKGVRLNQGILNFDLYRCGVKQDAKKPETFVITFNGNEREFWFKAENSFIAKIWVGVINQNITQSKGFKENALAPKTHEFWKQE